MRTARAFTDRHFGDLGALYRALAKEDVAPSDEFSDRVVPGEGPLHAGVMLIGEQPGDQEDLSGHPFVGPAGRLLDECLREAGIVRDDAFVTNAVKRFKFVQRGKRRLHQRPKTDEIVHYRWWLAEEIRLVDPSTVVTLGAIALQAVTGKRMTLASLRGKPRAWEGRRLIATIHPSYLLRIPDADAKAAERERLVEDLRMAGQD
ncbi:UdgX family uracil-DNA binding protein (plasmid) [Novosphingobium sp. BL-8A]|uniref:UdgX family uracil-DNA binding protein n=1 Tax=Novosphingobium sp. BL-8A TaxID=3127639 RepID=UPI003756E072